MSACRRPKPWPFALAVDSNELQPNHQGWRFGWVQPAIDVVPTNLYVGDYSIVGYETQTVVERKSKSDLYGSLGKAKRENMEDRVLLMSQMTFAVIVVESSFLDCLNDPPRHSKVHPRSVAGTVYAWQQRFPRVHWWFLDNAGAAEVVTFRLLERFWKDRNEP